VKTLRDNKRTLLLGACLTALLLAAPAVAQIPVECGDTLDIPDGYYALTHDLNCELTGPPDQNESWFRRVHITADGVRFDLAGYSMTGPGFLGPLVPGTEAIGINASNTAVVDSVGGSLVWNYPVGFAIDFVDHNRISNITFAQNLAGGLVVGASDNQITGNTFSNSIFTGLWLFLGSSRNNIQGNTINGVFLDDTFAFWLIQGSSDNRIVNNEVSNGFNGIVLGGGDSNLVAGNKTHDNDAAGITAYLGSENNIRDNESYDNGIGIAMLLGASGNLVKENIAEDNGVDLSEDTGGCNNRWSRNTFFTEDGPAGCID
jgi:parallel beta-helix repeat protein